ncbi:hypothetical protein CKAH01_12226 [Colletotrichum kahawae]|uniref:Uncharacterized protein n=1 Tax=Colletotrichum kahawae TaxID=34407 RepID=A0AAE0DCS3_COLKA|nr:hypothetical protein CKAH01_12226 [Colletotrichum kahawae]
MRRNLQSIVAFSMRATIQARDQQSIHYEHCAFLFLNRLPDLDRPPKLKKACLGLGWRRMNSKPALSQRRQRLSGRRAVSTIVTDIGTRARDEARGVAPAMPSVSIGFAVTTSRREPSSAVNLQDILLVAGAYGITGQPSMASVAPKRDCDATPRDRPFA